MTAADRLARLREEIIRLGPWHLDVEVEPGVSTRAWFDAGEPYPDSLGPVAFLDLRSRFHEQLAQLYPSGLEGRSFLDCACNCGGYAFWAKEAGAGRCFGFDAREHWIRQARFLLEHRTGPKDDVAFAVADLYDLPAMDLPPFDVTLFKGILYHLPDPIQGLAIAAKLTRELMVLNTSTMSGWPDGALVIDNESTEEIMSGVHGLNWYPTGPLVVARMLRWVGFVETRLTWWVPEHKTGRGRLELLASKVSGLLDAVPDLTPEEAVRAPASSGKSA